MGLTIRREEESDYRTVEEVTREAFWNLYAPGADEHFLIHNLRRLPEFLPELSLVAEMEGRIVGHIGYSLSKVQGCEESYQVLTFGPVSVLPSEQGKGIGSKLIKTSMAQATTLGHKAIVIQGYPFYYKRFGFENGSRFGICDENGDFPKALQVLELQPGAMDGIRGKHIASSVFETDKAALEEFDRTFPNKEKFRTLSQTAFEIMCSLKHDDPDPEGIEAMAVCRSRLAGDKGDGPPPPEP